MSTSGMQGMGGGTGSLLGQRGGKKVADDLMTILFTTQFVAQNMNKVIDLAALGMTVKFLEFGDAASNAWKFISDSAKWAGDSIVEAFKAAFASIEENFRNLGSSIGAFLKNPTGGFNLAPHVRPDFSGIGANASSLSNASSLETIKGPELFEKEKQKLTLDYFKSLAEVMKNPAQDGPGWFDSWLTASKPTVPTATPFGQSPGMPPANSTVQFAQAAMQGSREAVQAEMQWRAGETSKKNPVEIAVNTSNKLQEQIREEIRLGVRYGQQYEIPK